MPDAELHILIAIRSEKLTHLSKCIEYFLSQHEISKLVICLTEINDDYKKYLPLLHEFQKKDGRLIYTTFKGGEGYKAEQINVALKSIQQQEQKVIVGIYDIDSRPEKKVFNYVLNRDIQIGQQFTIYDANLKELNLLSLASALHQTFWSIGFEMFNFFHPNNRLVYTIGHGLYLSTETLNVCGLFEERCIVEDLMYGYKSSVAGRKFHAIPFFEHSKFAKTAIEFISQSERWYAGELELLQRYKGWGYMFNGTKKDRGHFYLRIMEIFWWPLERIVYIVTISGAIFGLINIKVALLYTIVLVFSGYISMMLILKYKGWDKRLFFSPLLVPVWHVVSIIGPIGALIKKISGSSVTWTITNK